MPESSVKIGPPSERKPPLVLQAAQKAAQSADARGLSLLGKAHGLRVPEPESSLLTIVVPLREVIDFYHYCCCYYYYDDDYELLLLLLVLLLLLLPVAARGTRLASAAF